MKQLQSGTRPVMMVIVNEYVGFSKNKTYLGILFAFALAWLLSFLLPALHPFLVIFAQ